MSSIDHREDLVADLARRAALAASEKRRSQREAGAPSTTTGLTATVHEDYLGALAPVLDQIAQHRNVRGIKLTRGPGALGLAAISESGIGNSEASEVDHQLTIIASSISHQAELVAGGGLGDVQDTAISLTDGAVLGRWIGQDLLLVAVGGRPAPIREVWTAMRSAAPEIESICSTISI